MLKESDYHYLVICGVCIKLFWELLWLYDEFFFSPKQDGGVLIKEKDVFSDRQCQKLSIEKNHSDRE